MNIFFGLLTVVLFFDCVVLIFLVLLQLPKKEAGAGTAFGGAATDALFGAGSGNALTALTQYAAGIFFGLALIMAIMMAQRGKNSANELTEALSKGTTAAPRMVAPAPSNAPAASNAVGNGLLQAVPPSLEQTNAAATAPGTNVAPPISTPPALQLGTNQ
jgi:protein translocase SecG subunit